MNAQYFKEKGLSMIEVVLTLVVVTALFLVFLKAQQQTTTELSAKRTAEAMQDVADNFTEYLLGNRDDLIAAMTDGTGAAGLCVINANPVSGSGTVAQNSTLHTCAVDISFLKFKKVVPPNFGEVNNLKQRWTAIYRLVYEDYDNNPSTPDETEGSVEMLIVGAKNGGLEESATAEEALLVASIAGYNGGYIPDGQWGPCRYNGTAKEACSVGGGWSATLSKFVNTP